MPDATPQVPTVPAPGGKERAMDASAGHGEIDFALLEKLLSTMSSASPRPGRQVLRQAVTAAASRPAPVIWEACRWAGDFDRARRD